jgi:hypothetical protein
MAKKTAEQTVNEDLNSLPPDAGAETTTPPPTRPRKLEKDLATMPGKVIIKVLGGSGKDLIFDPADLNEDVRGKLIPFGLGHKLGDSAAGREGMDAEEAILKVWEGLVSGDWTVRAPAQPKISLKELAANFQNLPDELRPQALEMFAQLGIKIPGITE